MAYHHKGTDRRGKAKLRLGKGCQHSGEIQEKIDNA